MAKWLSVVPGSYEMIGAAKDPTALGKTWVKASVRPTAKSSLRPYDSWPIRGIDLGNSLVISNLFARPSADQVLSRCPDQHEIGDIFRDFDIDLDASVDWNWSCMDSGAESSPMLLVVNIFRIAKALRFARPMPLFNTLNLYEYLRSAGLRFRFSNSGSEGRDGVVTFGLPPPVLMPYYRRWDNSDVGLDIGLNSSLALMVHEVRHATTGLAHGCPGRVDPASRAQDPSLSYGGAWAAQYWLYLWLADYSGTFLTDTQRNLMRSRAASLRSGAFCDPNP